MHHHHWCPMSVWPWTVIEEVHLSPFVPVLSLYFSLPHVRVSVHLIMSSIFVLWASTHVFWPWWLYPQSRIVTDIMLSCTSVCGQSIFVEVSLIVFRRLRVSPAITSTSSFDNLSNPLDFMNMRMPYPHLECFQKCLQSSFLRHPWPCASRDKVHAPLLGFSPRRNP